MEKTFYRTFDVQQVEKDYGGIDCIPSRLAEAVEEDVGKIGASVITLGKYGHLSEVLQQQEGVFRVNCRGTQGSALGLALSPAAETDPYLYRLL